MAKQITIKKCTHCKRIKSLSEFHKAAKSPDGRQYWCKNCNKEGQHLYMRKWHKTEKGQAVLYRYRHSEQGLAQSRRAYQNNRQKKIASACVRYKVRKGLMPHPKTLMCAQCGEQAKQYHHHHGYSKKHRYDVVPICQICHSKIHTPRINHISPIVFA